MLVCIVNLRAANLLALLILPSLITMRQMGDPNLTVNQRSVCPCHHHQHSAGLPPTLMQAIAGDFAKLESETALEEDRSSLFIQQCTELGNPMIVVGMILNDIDISYCHIVS